MHVYSSFWNWLCLCCIDVAVAGYLMGFCSATDAHDAVKPSFAEYRLYLKCWLEQLLSKLGSLAMMVMRSDLVEGGMPGCFVDDAECSDDATMWTLSLLKLEWLFMVLDSDCCALEWACEGRAGLATDGFAAQQPFHNQKKEQSLSAAHAPESPRSRAQAIVYINKASAANSTGMISTTQQHSTPLQRQQYYSSGLSFPGFHQISFHHSRGATRPTAQRAACATWKSASSTKPHASSTEMIPAANPCSPHPVFQLDIISCAYLASSGDQLGAPW
ncbi:hypothetical protein Nepgr_025377 [Nepenthes gracilis]|uniref:Uncharacterized protein n=1 Tax=Nepenthes gracilis TaxID=150966 RepID=A0AAD3Y0Z9_NEPGR|nr:hypothetical protein Nepgr_025377 [Nepenthes gracilis]